MKKIIFLLLVCFKSFSQIISLQCPPTYNCVPNITASGGITGGGATNYLIKFVSPSSVGNSIISNVGNLVSVNGTLTVNPSINTTVINSNTISSNSLNSTNINSSSINTTNINSNIYSLDGNNIIYDDGDSYSIGDNSNIDRPVLLKGWSGSSTIRLENGNIQYTSGSGIGYHSFDGNLVINGANSIAPTLDLNNSFNFSGNKTFLNMFVDDITNNGASIINGVVLDVSNSGTGTGSTALKGLVYSGQLKGSKSYSAGNFVGMSMQHSIGSTLFSGASVADSYLIQLKASIFTASAKPTTVYGLSIANQGVTGVTTSHGINILAQSGSTNAYAFTSASGNLHGFGTIAPKSTVDVVGSMSHSYVAKTATYTLTSTDYTIDCTSGTFTLNLPTAVGITGRVYVVRNSGVGTITLDANGTETINGTLTMTLATTTFTTIQSTGANWISY